jgi:hypothetical protein
VFKLRIACAERYPGLIRECELAIAQVLPNKGNKVSKTRKTNERCWDVHAFSKHWPCLLPQHGPGRKHERKIGCRVLNWVNGTAYPRYHFTDVSADIRGIFGRACDQLGIEWRRTTGGACRWPGGGAWPCWTSSWGPSVERG